MIKINTIGGVVAWLFFSFELAIVGWFFMQDTVCGAMAAVVAIHLWSMSIAVGKTIMGVLEVNSVVQQLAKAVFGLTKIGTSSEA